MHEDEHAWVSEERSYKKIVSIGASTSFVVRNAYQHLLAVHSADASLDFRRRLRLAHLNGNRCTHRKDGH